jgi:phosphoribosylformylglycinamidine cyclo-ligase
MSLYGDRGVSTQKEEVHTATANLDKGLYPNSFCKLYQDRADPDYAELLHADGAGTKSITAYLYWKETGDNSLFRGIAQDAIVMNTDDMLCVGIHDNFDFSSTIDRNKTRVDGEVLKQLIEGGAGFFDHIQNVSGINFRYMCGETADVGDAVRTITVNATMKARWPKDKIIANDKIQAGDVIVGFSSFGQASYETSYNSGIGSNGLTSARHDLLRPMYRKKYPETYEPRLQKRYNGKGREILYIGKHKLTDKVDVGNDEEVDVGHLILSPTRTYLPIVKEILENHFDIVHGMIHCSGGGQTKIKKFLPDNLRAVKDNLFTPAPIFRMIQDSSGENNRNMHEAFNMGHRFEIIVPKEDAQKVIDISTKYRVDAQIVGRIEESDKPEVIIYPAINKGERLVY